MRSRGLLASGRVSIVVLEIFRPECIFVNDGDTEPKGESLSRKSGKSTLANTIGLGLTVTCPSDAPRKLFDIR
jgi:hypothetical protein